MAYNVKAGKGGTIFLTKKQIADYIVKQKISISCSDDFYYNEMNVVKDADHTDHYFVVYENNTVTIYTEPGRGRGEEVDVNKLPASEVLYK